MATKTTTTTLKLLRERFQLIATQAIQAQSICTLPEVVENDTLCDLLDALDNDVQAAIEMLRAARSIEKGDA